MLPINSNEYKKILKSVQLISSTDILDLSTEDKKEIEKINSGTLVILVGFGDGLFLQKLLENREIYNLAIIEPFDNNIADKQRNILLSIKKTTNNAFDFFEFQKGTGDIKRFYQYIAERSIFLDNVEIIINPEYISTHSKSTLQTIKEIKKIILEINSLRGNSIGDEIYGIMNALYNLRKIDSLRMFPDIKCKNIIVVAAGPSLDNHLEELKTLSDKFIIVAVEVVVEKLLKLGIFPDIICSQERTYTVYSDYIRKFDKRIKEKAIYMAPTIVHTYNLDEMKNTVLLSQNTRTNSERYLYENYYHFSKSTYHSIHAGQFAINVAALFKPENILLFGLDLSIPENSKSHAKDISAKSYSSKNDVQERGNRGQKIFISQLLKRFYDNTDKVVQQIKEEQTINFYNFSDGKQIKHFENSTNVIYQQFLKEPADKKDLLSKLTPVDEKTKDKIREHLNQEFQLLRKQTDFLTSIKDVKTPVLIRTFVESFLNRNSLFSQTGRFFLNDFRAKHTYKQENMEKWILEQADSLLKTAVISKELMRNTINLLKKNEQLPDPEKDKPSELYQYKFYAVIRERYLDNNRLKDEISAEEYSWLIKSFLNAFQPINYQQFQEILSQFKNKKESSEEYEGLYQKGINRCVEFYLIKYQNTSDAESHQLLRKKIEWLLYESDRHNDLINFINGVQAPLPYEIELLANSYKKTQEYENSSLLYKALIKNNIINQQIILNYFECLIKAGKLAEALYFNGIIKDNFCDISQYEAASTLLKKKISIVFDENNHYEKLQDNAEINRLGYIEFTNKQISEDSDKIIGLIGKQQNLPFFKSENKYYYDKEPDTQFFIDRISFSSQ